MLTHEEVLKLIEKAQKGDGLAKEILVTENSPLIKSIIKRFIGKGIEYDDLIQAGCIGLIKAVDRFDSTKGVQFSTYAVPCILGEIKRLFRDGGIVKVGRNLRELSLKIKLDMKIAI